MTGFLTSGHTYDEAGRPKSIAYPASSGITLWYGETVGGDWVPGFDADGRLLKMRYVRNDGSGDARLLELEYSYDDSSNRTGMVETDADGNVTTWSYGYDWLDRLSSVYRDTGSGAELMATYAYDESDNMVTRVEPTGTTTFEHDAADQLTVRKVDGANAETFVHDADGNMTSRTLTATSATTTYTFDDVDHIVRMGLSTGTERNAYDDRGLRRSSTSVDGVTTTFTFDEGTERSFLAGEVNQQTTMIMADVIRGFETGAQFYSVLSDALGHVRCIIDSDGTPVFTGTYDVWGNVISESGVLAGSWFCDYMGALGCRRDDADSGLVYCRARWLDPNLGRFVSRDILGGLNRYAYAFNNPVRFADSSGLWVDGPPDYTHPRSLPTDGWDLPISTDPAAWLEFGLHSTLDLATMLMMAAAAEGGLNPLADAGAAAAYTSYGLIAFGGALLGFHAPQTINSARGLARMKDCPAGDDISKIPLRGKGLTSGSKKLTQAGLKPRPAPGGGIEFADSKGIARVRWDRGSAQGPNHWHKFWIDEKGVKHPLTDGGRIIDDKFAPKVHIPSK